MSEEVIQIFYSYSRKDLDMLNKLEDHLSALKEANKISTWHDLQGEAGIEWEPTILNKLNTADIILLLVSRNFIASKYCYGIELKRAITRYNEGTARVIPIILSPCDWNHPDVPFSKLNVLPTHAKAITSWADPDEAFTIVVQQIRKTVDQLRAKKLAEEQQRQELAFEKGMDYRRTRDLVNAMARRVFFSFHYQQDIWRVNVVRNHAILKSGYQEAGYWDCSLWESTKRTGEIALKQLIDSGLQNTSVTVVLIGTETSERKWVKYEIEESHKRGNGMLGIYIHNIRNKDGATDLRGRNPFDNFTIKQPSQYAYMSKTHVSMSQVFPTYDWVYDKGYNNFSKWVEDAARAAGR